MAQVGSGTVAVVGQGLDHDSNAAGAVALVGDGLELGLVTALSLLDDALDVIVGHAHALCLGDQVCQLAVGSRVGAAVTDGNADLAADLGKDLCSCAIGLFLLALNVVPFAMSRHGEPPKVLSKSPPAGRRAVVARLWQHTKSNSIIVAQSRIPFKGSGRVFRLFVLENRLFRPVYSSRRALG